LRLLHSVAAASIWPAVTSVFAAACRLSKMPQIRPLCPAVLLAVLAAAFAPSGFA